MPLFSAIYKPIIPYFSQFCRLRNVELINRSLFGAERPVLRPVACSQQATGANGGQGTEMLAKLTQLCWVSAACVSQRLDRSEGGGTLVQARGNLRQCICPGGVVLASCSTARAIQRQVTAPSGSSSASN